jgi:hypothetical protein
MTAELSRPKTSGDWSNSVIAGGFLKQNFETEIHMFLGGLRTARRGVPLFAHPDSAVSGNDVSATMMKG